MLTRDGRLLYGLPTAVLHGPDCCAAAVWRAALVATGPSNRNRPRDPAGDPLP